MVPLYAARVQDLGPGDVAVFKCGACGYTAELPSSVLLREFGLKPTDKVLDLERRLGPAQLSVRPMPEFATGPLELARREQDRAATRGPYKGNRPDLTTTRSPQRRGSRSCAHSGEGDRPIRPKVITDSGDRDHADEGREGPA